MRRTFLYQNRFLKRTSIFLYHKKDLYPRNVTFRIEV